MSVDAVVLKHRDRQFEIGDLVSHVGSNGRERIAIVVDGDGTFSSAVMVAEPNEAGDGIHIIETTTTAVREPPSSPTLDDWMVVQQLARHLIAGTLHERAEGDKLIVRARQRAAEAETTIASMRRYAIVRCRAGNICRDGLNEFLTTHGLEQYEPAEPDPAERRAPDQYAVIGEAPPLTASPALRRLLGLTVVVWTAVAALSAVGDPWSIAAAGALAIGFSHLAGRCGMSHLGALTTQGTVPLRRRRWLVNAIVYGGAGSLASGLVGAGLAVAGILLVPTQLRVVAMAAVVLLALVAVSTDLGLIAWRLPEPRLQTRREWGQVFRPPVPAAMWGFALGTTVATVFTFSGTWVILAMPVAVGTPAFGAMLLLVHWLGRAVPILAGPVLLRDAGSTSELLDTIDSVRPLFRLTNVAGTGLLILSIVLLLSGTIA